mgnify:CR=1 FL=1
MNNTLKKLLLKQSQEVGFSMMRICAPSDIPNAASNLNSFIKSDTNIKIIMKIENNKLLISFDNISLQESINIPTSNYKVNYQFHWSNRFLNNIFNN